MNFMEAAILSRSFVPVNTYTHPDNLPKKETTEQESKKIYMTEEEEIEHLELKLKHIESQLETIEIQKETLVQEIEYEDQKTSTLNHTITDLNEQFQNYKKLVLPKLQNQWELNLKINNLNSNLTESIEDNNELIQLKNYLEGNLELVSGKWFEIANEKVEEERKKNFELERSVSRLDLLINDTLALAELEREQQIELRLMIEKLENAELLKSPNTISSIKGIKTPPTQIPSSPSLSLSQDNNEPIKYTLKPDFNHPKFLQFKEFLKAPSKKGIYQSSNFWKSTLVDDIEPSTKFNLEASTIWSNQRQIINFLVDNKIKINYFNNSNGSEEDIAKINQICSLCTQKLSNNPLEVNIHLPGQSLSQAICSNCEFKLIALIELTKYLKELRNFDKSESNDSNYNEDEKEENYLKLLKLKQKLFLARSGSNFYEGLD